MPKSATLPDDFGGGDTDAPRHRRYNVKEVFRTVQGEGYFAGTPAVFVRLAGCNMWSGYEKDRERDAKRNTPGDDAWGCPMWCDTDFKKEGADTLTARGIAGRIEEACEHGPIPPLIVCTGGEPLLQMDDAFCSTLRDKIDRRLTITVETNGTVKLRDAFGTPSKDASESPDWVCCSPKLPDKDLVIETCDEVKLIVPDFRPGNYTALAHRCRRRMTPRGPKKHLYVQPEDGPRFDEACEIAKTVATRDNRWRISTQSHKTIQIA